MIIDKNYYIIVLMIYLTIKFWHKSLKYFILIWKRINMAHPKGKQG